MDLAKRILQLCDERNMSINHLAEISCLTQSTVQNIIIRNSDALVGTIEKICEGLNMTLSEFFSEEKPEYPPEALKEIKAFEEYIRAKYGLTNHPGK